MTPFAPPLPNGCRYASIGVTIRVRVRVSGILKICQPWILVDELESTTSMVEIVGWGLGVGGWGLVHPVCLRLSSNSCGWKLRYVLRMNSRLRSRACSLSLRERVGALILLDWLSGMAWRKFHISLAQITHRPATPAHPACSTYTPHQMCDALDLFNNEHFSCVC